MLSCDVRRKHCYDMNGGKKARKIPNHLFHFLFKMFESPSPLKKRKVEIDFEKCLLCQSDEKSEYHKPNVETLKELYI